MKMWWRFNDTVMLIALVNERDVIIQVCVSHNSWNFY